MRERLFDNKSWTMIAGPCAAESEEQVMQCARTLKSTGTEVLRLGVWKARTSRDSWQGAREVALDWAKKAKEETGMAIATEVISTRTLETALEAGFDMVWVGSRNAQNFDLLEEVGRQTSDGGVAVGVKRGMACLLGEWIAAAQYAGYYNPNIVLCERGIRGVCGPDTRFVLDLQTAKLAQRETDWPVIIDVSHAGGRRDLVLPMAVASKAAGFNGLMVEVHPNPDSARSDSQQQISLEGFRKLTQALERIPSLDSLYE